MGGGHKSEEGRGLGLALALCAAIFFTDASHSATIPTFPFFASSLGASPSMIGALASVAGLSTMVSPLPFGVLSDRLGRKRVMMLGVACFVAVPLLYLASRSPVHLLPARALLGVARASTFSIGFLFVSEVAPQSRRSLVQGLYLTSMGVGFTVGPLIGGITAKIWGYASSFYVTSGLAVLGLIPLLFIPMSGSSSGGGGFAGMLSGFRRMLRSPQILAAGMANFFNSMLYNATMVFYPLYGRSVGLDESQVGVSLTVRGMVSTASRLPTGSAALRLGAFRLMTLGLGVSALTMLALPAFEGLVLISAILGVQGVAYGVYLTSGNIYVTEEAPAGERGMAMGVYSTFSNLSGVLSPVMLGAVSEAFGLKNSLRFSALVALVGILLLLAFSRRGGSSKN